MGMMELGEGGQGGRNLGERVTNVRSELKSQLNLTIIDPTVASISSCHHITNLFTKLLENKYF